MAAVSWKSFPSVLKTCSFSSIKWSKGPCNRFYSVYAPNFLEPTVDVKAIEKIIQEESEKEILSRKIKPALGFHSCSVFYHPDIVKFTNIITRRGNKHIARDIVHNALTKVKHIQLRKYNNETNPEKKKNIIINPVEMFSLAIKNCTPMLWYVKIKRSGTWYKVPVGIDDEQAKGKALKWLFTVSSDKDPKIKLKDQLALEIIDAANNEGRVVAKKIEIHKMCEANRGFVNYWWT